MRPPGWGTPWGGRGYRFCFVYVSVRIRSLLGTFCSHHVRDAVWQCSRLSVDLCLTSFATAWGVYFVIFCYFFKLFSRLSRDLFLTMFATSLKPFAHHFLISVLTFSCSFPRPVLTLFAIVPGHLSDNCATFRDLSWQVPLASFYDFRHFSGTHFRQFPRLLGTFIGSFRDFCRGSFSDQSRITFQFVSDVLGDCLGIVPTSCHIDKPGFPPPLSRKRKCQV